MHQRTLGRAGIDAFGHDDFVRDQVRDFAALCPDYRGPIFDMGGGCGFFARALSNRGASATVVDLDGTSIRRCRALGVDAIQADALRFSSEGLAAFNLILHHLVGATERETRVLQIAALSNWEGAVFVNEYIYDAWLGDVAGRAIYALTTRLTIIARTVGRIFPALRANTCGVGVRFRSRRAWKRLFADAGFEIAGERRGEEEVVHPLLRPLVRSIRRDSFMLRPRLPEKRG